MGSLLGTPPPERGRSTAQRSGGGRDPHPIPPLFKGREAIAARKELRAIGLRSRAGGWPKRAVLAGIAWGVPMAALLVSLEVWHCGVLCLTDAAITLAVTMIAGISTIGVFAALFGGTAPGPMSRRNLSQKGTSWLASSS